MRRSHDLDQMVGIRPYSRDIVRAQILEPDCDDVDAMRIGGELAAGIEQRLFDLVVRREPDFEIQIQVASPEGDDWF